MSSSQQYVRKEYVRFDPKNMPFRQMGRSGLRVPILSLGSWLTVGGTEQGDIAKQLLVKAFGSGINMFDSAEGYSAGKAEEEIGRVVHEMNWKRSDLILTTKIFFGVDGKEPNAKGLSRKHIIEGLDASLERLRTPYVDLVFAHRPDRTVGMEEIVRAFTHCINTGKAFYWGTSEWSAAELVEAHFVAEKFGLIAPVVEQPQYNMFTRERFESEYLSIWKLGMGSTIWSPLASGLLTGKYNDGIPAGSRFDNHKDFFKDTLNSLGDGGSGKAKIEKVRKLTEIATELDTSMTNLALAWCCKHENVSTVILGATKVHQIEENLKAVEVLPKLTDSIMERIDAILENKPAPLSMFGR